MSTTDGQVVSGVPKETDGPFLRLMTADGTLLTIPKADIDEQKRGDSAMPDDLVKLLTRPELRDLVEYLSTLK